MGLERVRAIAHVVVAFRNTIKAYSEEVCIAGKLAHPAIVKKQSISGNGCCNGCSQAVPSSLG